MHNLAESFALILAGLKATVAYFANADRARAAFLMLVWRRLNRLSNRFVDLFARWKAGTLPKPRLRVRAPRPPSPRPASPETDRPRLPTRRLWLVREIQPTATQRNQLRYLFANDPDLVAFLTEVPQARRLLNGLCRMLGIDLEAPHGVSIGLPPPPVRTRRKAGTGRAAPPTPPPATAAAPAPRETAPARTRWRHSPA